MDKSHGLWNAAAWLWPRLLPCSAVWSFWTLSPENEGNDGTWGIGFLGGLDERMCAKGLPWCPAHRKSAIYFPFSSLSGWLTSFLLLPEIRFPHLNVRSLSWMILKGSFWCSKILGLLSNLCCLWYMSTLQLSGLLSHSSLRGGIARDEQTSPGGWNHWTLTIIQLLQFEHTLCLAPLKASYANKAFSSSHPLTEVGTSIIIPNVQVRKLRLINPPWAPIQES